MELLMQIVTFVAPLIAGFITSIVIPIVIKRYSLKRIEKKISEISEAEELKAIKKELAEIKKEILEMRGKRK